ncbi:hypothetical protein QVD17_26076 [Tagetes erecta]|uniref:Uncharacterized protein n=1 Tax=Tagetes erecta TaxID=13708 RepID=A0AAD8NQG9_TARER|nr:hypothetical protein QVD17_26076 [Tagetes erecta]
MLMYVLSFESSLYFDHFKDISIARQLFGQMLDTALRNGLLRSGTVYAIGLYKYIFSISNCSSTLFIMAFEIAKVANPKRNGHGITKKCASLVKQQRARIYILRRCATMLLCWYIQGDD